MKTFLNVLYRRILYKIPLKLLLFLLVLFGLLFLGFSKADYTLPLAGFAGNDYTNGAYEYKGQDVDKYNQKLTLSSDYDFYCFIRLDRNNGAQYSFDNSTWYNGPNYNVYCDNKPVYIKSNHMLFYYYKFGQGMIPTQYTSLECQTVYNLIPIESVDQSYCVSNNLCPVEECPDVPVYTGDISQLYINNILHVGAPTILMNIPDEIDWDYAYTMGGNTMNIDIVGYNVDYDKINEQINLQNFKPSSEDLSQVVSGIIPLFVPGLCIILLLYFIFKFIKKIF